MEITANFRIHDTRFASLKRIEINEQVFLVSKQGISQRKEVILHKEYEGVPMVNGVVLNLDLKASFVFRNKLLEVEAVSKVCYGPLGERLHLNVWYDGFQIGNWSALYSYMGGGTQGTWPIIRCEDGILFFTFNRKGMIGKANVLLIEYFRTIIADPVDIHLSVERKYISSENLPEGFVSKQYNLEKLKSKKKILWLLPLRDSLSKKEIGALSSCVYPGYEQYQKQYNGNLLNLPLDERNATFIAQSLGQINLYMLSYEQDGVKYTHNPWGSTRIGYNL
jgi:hypothetical protein